jgi:mevalonate kinase
VIERGKSVLGSQRGIGEASGKVILLGEHAVVYDVPAIVVGIDRGATACAASMAADQADPRLFGALLEACAIDGPVRVDVHTDLPAAAGLGCSAALGVAIVRAFDAWRGKPVATPSETIERAMAWEKIFHGNPSGIDATAAARGGCLFYQRVHGGVSVKEIRLSDRLTLAIGHSGIASSTRAMVEHVAKLRKRREALVLQSFEGISSLVSNARLALESNDKVGLGRLMDLNQMILSGLMLSTEEIETMCRLAREAGALGAKLTGAGGGGCVVALVEADPEPILERWNEAGFRAFSTQVVALPSTAAEAREAP